MAASQSTAPKLRISRFPTHSFGTSNILRYQRRSALFMTPLSADSTGNGTSILPVSSRPAGGFSPAVATAYSHIPFRFFHSFRVSCGRGYSMCAFSGVTCRPHDVIIRAPRGMCHPGPGAAF